jgi:hypothetical protein
MYLTLARQRPGRALTNDDTRRVTKPAERLARGYRHSNAVALSSLAAIPDFADPQKLLLDCAHPQALGVRIDDLEHYPAR